MAAKNQRTSNKTIKNMLEISQSTCPIRDLTTLSILVISPSYFCGKITDALHKIHRRKRRSYNLSVVNAEKIRDILDFRDKIHADFIVFIVDTGNPKCRDEVDLNLHEIDQKFLIGRICIVNGTPYKPHVDATLNMIIELVRSFDFPLINSDVLKPEKCLLLAERILILADSTLNRKTTLIPWLFS